MPIDANIALQTQLPQIQNPIDTFAKAQNLRALTFQNDQSQRQANQQMALGDLVRKNTSVDETGMPKVNMSSLVSQGIAPGSQVNPQDVLAYAKQLHNNDFEALKQSTEAANNIATSILPDGSNYAQQRQKAISLGLPNAQLLPQNFDPTFVQNWQQHTLTGDQYIKAQEAQAKIADTSENRAARLQAASQNQQDRQDKQSADAYQKASHDLETFRGNQAAQQASVALTNAKNALSLADKGNLSPDQLHLFASEMGKLATGGVPGQTEVEALVPDTAKARLAKVTSFFSNNPTDADAQAFINNNRSYLNDMVSNYQSVLDKYRENTLSGYKKKLSADDLADLRSRYPTLANTGAKANPSGGGTAGSGTVQMKDPQGNIRAVPANMVEQAKAAGGVPL
jgi:hypothetical protein